MDSGPEYPDRLAVIVDVAQLKSDAEAAATSSPGATGSRAEGHYCERKTTALLADVALLVSLVVAGHRRREEERTASGETHSASTTAPTRETASANTQTGSRARRVQWTFRIFDSSESLMSTEKDLAQLARQVAEEDEARSKQAGSAPLRQPQSQSEQFEDFDFSSFRHFLRLVNRFGRFQLEKAKVPREGKTQTKLKIDGLQQVSRCLTGVLSKLDHNASPSWIFLFTASTAAPGAREKVEEGSGKDVKEDSAKGKEKGLSETNKAMKRIGEILDSQRTTLKWFSTCKDCSGIKSIVPKSVQVLQMEAVMDDLREERSLGANRGLAILEEAASLTRDRVAGSGLGLPSLSAHQNLAHLLSTRAGENQEGEQKATGTDRTRTLLDKSLKSYQLDLRLMQPSLERRMREKEKDKAKLGVHKTEPAPVQRKNAVADGHLELESFYSTSETGLKPQVVVQKVVRTFFPKDVCEMGESFEACKMLFVDRSRLKEKYGRGFTGRKGVKVREYLTQILLRLEAASQAMAKVPESREENLLGKKDLRDLKQMLGDIMFAMPAATPGSGVKEFLETVVSPSFPLLENSVHHLKAHFGLASQPKNKSSKRRPPSMVGAAKKEKRDRSAVKKGAENRALRTKAKTKLGFHPSGGLSLSQSQTSLQNSKVGQQKQDQAQPKQLRFHGNLSRKVSLNLRRASAAGNKRERVGSGRENKKPCVRRASNASTVMETPFVKRNH